MNLAEKIAATYLRLNGFFLLPQFTVFTGGNQHNHIDILALRASNCRELVTTETGERDLPVDQKLFDLFENGSLTRFVGLVVQVKSNDQNKPPKEHQVEYVKSFFGDSVSIVEKVSFYHDDFFPRRNGSVIEISIVSAANWIQSRIKEMENMKGLRCKSKSWTWSEQFLADFLQLYDYGLLKA